MKNDIFIAIASFLDPELPYTIKDCIEKSENPDNLHFGVCLQHDNENKLVSENILDELEKQYNITTTKFHYKESKGGCWARYHAQQLYNNETYHLQVDSHTRFRDGWDKKCIDILEELKTKSDKPYLSFLPPIYLLDKNTHEVLEYKFLNDLNLINIPKIKFISNEYWIDYSGYDNLVHLNEPQISPLLYGGFIFSDGEWVEDIEQDPEHYYTGEELALAIRSYTHGYDCYLSNEILAWHRGDGTYTPKHFTKLSDGKPEHKIAMERLRKLIEGEDLGKYGLGSKRTLEEYESFAGIDFKNKKLL